MQKLVFFGCFSLAVTLVSGTCQIKVDKWVNNTKNTQYFTNGSDYIYTTENVCFGCVPDPIPLPGSRYQRCGAVDIDAPNGVCYAECQDLIDEINTACTFGSVDISNGEYDTLAHATIYNPESPFYFLDKNYGGCDYGFEYTQCNLAIDNFKDFMRDNRPDCGFQSGLPPPNVCPSKCTDEVEVLLLACKDKDLRGFSTNPDVPNLDNKYVYGRMYTWDATEPRVAEEVWKGQNRMSETCKDAAVYWAAYFAASTNNTFPDNIFNPNDDKDDKDDKDEGGLDQAMIAGIVGGLVAVIALGAGLFMYKKHKSTISSDVKV